MYRRFVGFIVVAAAAVSYFGACQGQPEGERCSLADDPGGPNNTPGSSDCGNNLVCTSAASLNGVAAEYAAQANDPTLGICCPVNRYPNDPVTICATQSSPADAAPPPADAAATDSSADASPGEGGAGDGGNEDASDAGALADAASG